MLRLRNQVAFANRGQAAAAAAPALFVLLWSTGFIGARLGTPYAEPQTFLLTRFALVFLVMTAVVVVLRPPLPAREVWRHEAVTGVLLHSGYLGGVFAAINSGLPAAYAALIVGLQPLLTAAVVGPILGDRLTGRAWIGLFLGLVGVCLVLSEKLAATGRATLFDGFGLDAVVMAALALIAMTAGTLYQKRFGGKADWRVAGVAQYGAATVVTGAVALGLGIGAVAWTGEFVLALGWLVLVLSVGAVTLLMLLIRRGAAAKVASLFYLVPPCTAVMAWLFFDERMGWTAVLGMLVTATGVALTLTANRKP